MICAEMWRNGVWTGMGSRDLEAEYPAIFNWILEGRDRFIANGYKLTDSKELENVMVSLLRLRAATFSESAPNAATIISKVFFSIDTISIFMQLSVCPQR